MIPHPISNNIQSTNNRSRHVALVSQPQKKHVRIIHTETFSEFCKRYFISEEVNINMTKGTLMGLVAALMLLGILFFLSGFLAAMHLYTAKPTMPELPDGIHNPLSTPYHTPTQPAYATASSSRMPSSSKRLPTTGQRSVIVPSERAPSNNTYTTYSY